jgi:hypothetical protein
MRLSKGKNAQTNLFVADPIFKPFVLKELQYEHCGP